MNSTLVKIDQQRYLLIFLLFLFLLSRSKPNTLGIIYRYPDQSSLIDDSNIALKELAPQGNELISSENSI